MMVALVGIAVFAVGMLMWPSHDQREYKQRQAKRALNDSLTNRGRK
jgi:hypothetical protein